MKRGLALLTLAGSLLISGCSNEPPKLVLELNFDGPEGAAPPAPLSFQTGGGGWGNNELQTYTDRSSNAALDGKGNLRIIARREGYTGGDGIYRDYTSARLSTKGAFTFTYGRVEARVQTPQGAGVWPALWLLGDIPEGADWRTAGEIDIFEVFGTDPRRHATVHGYSEATRGWMRTGKTSEFDDLSAGFHDYVLDWTKDQVTISVDGKRVLTATADDLEPSQTWSVNKAMYLIMNVAVGGTMAGPPDDTSPFPAEMLVDSLKVYQEGQEE